jgi:hypothetical protein
MHALKDAFIALGAEPIGTAVFVGADAATLEAAAALACDRLVLVQGDPEAADELRQTAADNGLGAEVITAAVAPRPGPLTWNRFRPETLNGPLDAAAWRTLYPRLATGPTLALEGTAIGELMRRIAPEARPGRRQLLVLDVAGQERGLLDALEPASLRTFDLVVLRSLRDAAPGRPGVAEALARLDAHGFAARPATGEPASAWIVHTLAFDKEKHRQQLRDERLQELERVNGEQVERLAKLAQELAALRTGRDEQAKLAAERAATIGYLEKDKAAAIAGRDEQTKLANERAARVTQLEKDKAQLAAERDSALKDKAAAIAGRDEQTKAARDAKSRLSTLEAEMVQVMSRHGLLQEELIKAEAQIELIADVLMREARA